MSDQTGLLGNQVPVPTIDISKALLDVSLTTQERPEELVSRLKLKELSVRNEETKGLFVFGAVLLFLTVIVFLSGYEGFIASDASLETKRWSQTVLSSLLTGSVTFVLSRKTPSK